MSHWLVGFDRRATDSWVCPRAPDLRYYANPEVEETRQLCVRVGELCELVREACEHLSAFIKAGIISKKDQDGDSSRAWCTQDGTWYTNVSTWENLWTPLIMLSIGSVVTIVPVLCSEESDGMENTMHIENYHKRLFASGLDYVFIFLASDTFAWFQTSMLWFLENRSLLGDDVEPWLIVNSAFACFIGLSVVPGYCWVMLDVTRQLCAGTLCDGDVCSEDTTLFWAVDCTQVGYHAGYKVTTDLGM